MPTNDQIILEQLLAERKQQIAPDLSDSDFFELFSAEQILKDYDVSLDDIQSGIVGQGGDGGIDSIYLFVNGELIHEDTELSIYRGDVALELCVIQSKTSPGFSEDALQKFDTSAKDLLQLETTINSLGTVYNEKLIAIISRFREAHEKFASKLPPLAIHYYYSAPAAEIHPNVSRQVINLEATIESLFSSADFKFDFIDARELIKLTRRQPTSVRSLQLAETPISVDNSFICLVDLPNYRSFISDKDGRFVKQMFDSNVRDYQGDIEVNNAIRSTLEGQDDQEDFWWLNNGVTILASEASLSGKSLTIREPQIVNGLQTSQEIHRVIPYEAENEQRRLLVRVIVPQAPESYQRIVKATNSQTNVPPASLRATDTLHRDIESFLKSKGLYYERRKNFYRNEGRPWEKIVSISALAQSVMAILLARPDDARGRPSTLIKNDEDYRSVFNADYPVTIYFLTTLIMKKVESFLRAKNPDRKFVSNLKYHNGDVFNTHSFKPD